MVTSYNEKDIVVTKGLEGLRLRPAMYIGNLENGRFSILKEILDNALDEATSGFSKKVGCILYDDGKDSCLVYDEGRGIPVGPHPDEPEKSTMEIVFTQLHAGGKLKKGAYSSGSVGCFTGDTRLKLLDGTYPTFEELWKKWEKDHQKFWVFSKNIEKSKHDFQINQCYGVYRTKQVTKLAIITLDNGEVIKCTIDHPFMKYDGDYIEAKDIQPGQSLSGLHWKFDKDNYEVYRVYPSEKIEESSKRAQYKSFGKAVHRRVADLIGLKRQKSFEHIHHINHNRNDNRPENLQILNRSEHFWADQNDHKAHEIFHSHAHQNNSQIMKNLNIKYNLTKENTKKKMLKCAARAILTYGKLTAQTYDSCRGWCYPRYFTVVPLYFTEKDLEKNAYSYIQKHGKDYILKYKLEKDYPNSPVANIGNHQVASIKFIDCEPTWVYGMSVENDHNYLLAAGVFVKNTHGIGSSATNALSDYFQAWTFRDGKWYTQTYSKGIPTSKVTTIPSTKLPISLKKGTIVKFTPDSSILKKRLDVIQVSEYMENCSFLNSGVIFELIDIKGNLKTFKSKGLIDFVKKITSSIDENGESTEKFENLGNPFIFSNEQVDVALQWFESDDSNLTSWVNSNKTIEGGTHLNGLIRLITTSFGDFAKKKNYKPEDLRVGLYGGLNIKIAEPQFDSQTKEKLINPEADKMVFDILRKDFLKYLEKNKSFVKRVIDRANEMRSIYNKFANEKKALSKIKTRGKQALPPPSKFIISNCKDDSLRELMICEGDSAGGSARQARNPYYQEILKLRGKILNTAKAQLSKVYESADIINILKALGFDPVNKEHRCRVGKVIFLTDADVDGEHISTLLLTLIKMYYPELLEQGKVFAVDAPLFIGKTRTRTIYGEDYQNLVKKAGNEKIQSVTRLKGWGEADAELLHDLAFNPATRKLIRITNVSGADFEYFKKIVGEDSKVRKQLLESL